MDTVKLRAHHIWNLRTHYKKVDAIYRHYLYKLYGEELAEHMEVTLKKILEGLTSVTIIDDYDEICTKCPNRVEEGCVVDGKFLTKDYITGLDRNAAKYFNVETGKTYDGKEFLTKALFS